MDNATAVKPVNHNCKCGCGFPVNHPQSTYLPGHDARHAGIVGRELVGKDLNSEEAQALLRVLPSGALQVKAFDMAVRLTAKAESKAAKRAAKDAFKKGLPKLVQEEGTIKAGRWTYPALREGAVISRNTKRDGSGEWAPATHSEALTFVAA